jgi:hypothetical protein
VKQREPKPTIRRHAQERIGRELRAMYQPFMQELLPEEFVALLHASEDAETARHRLKEAVANLRDANRALDIRPVSSGSSLSVHGQQMLVARAVRKGLGRSPTARALSRSRITGPGATQARR